MRGRFSDGQHSLTGAQGIARGKDVARKLYVKTHGCQMNEYDSARMQDLLRESHGLVPTDDPEEADVLLLNTCSIREKAQEKVFHQLGRWKHLKEKNPDLVIGVGGCVASQEGEAIQRRAPYVDMVFGPQTLHRLPEMVDAAAVPVEARQNRDLEIAPTGQPAGGAAAPRRLPIVDEGQDDDATTVAR